MEIAKIVCSFPIPLTEKKVFSKLNCGAYSSRIVENSLRFRSSLKLRSPFVERSEEQGKIACGSCFSTDFSGLNDSNGDFIVVNFYHFVYIANPEEEISKHLSFLRGLDIRGRIYVNEQGINAQYSGSIKDAFFYVEWLKEDKRFSEILVQTSPALSGHAFPRLRLQYKPSLVQIEGGTKHLPLHDPERRATPLTPSEWKKRMQYLDSGGETHEIEKPDMNRKSLLLDVRNGYEWDIGHFDGAQRPNVDCFRNTSFGLSLSEEIVSDPLADIDKENTDILMYCTGGIRCDVYSTILKERGFQNLYTLKGGVSNYLQNQGSVGWNGNLFVFDSRLSLPPSAYNSRAVAIESHDSRSKTSTFASCHICGSLVQEFRHRNCANIDCNFLFLCCSNCVEEMKGCCCQDCTLAPRLRPTLSGHQRYKKWHVYRDSGTLSKIHT